MEERISRSPEETTSLGQEVASHLTRGGLVHLSGPLGAGKTLLAKAIFGALGVDPDRVTSPTFTFVNEYRSATWPALPMHHVDLYRIETGVGLETLGLEEMFDAGGVVLVEWAERLGPGWNEPSCRITITDEGGDVRRIRIELPSTRFP